MQASSPCLHRGTTSSSAVRGGSPPALPAARARATAPFVEERCSCASMAELETASSLLRASKRFPLRPLRRADNARAATH